MKRIPSTPVNPVAGVEEESMRARNSRRISSFSNESTRGGDSGESGYLDDIPFATAVTVEEYSSHSAHSGYGKTSGATNKGGAPSSSSGGGGKKGKGGASDWNSGSTQPSKASASNTPNTTLDNTPQETPSGKAAKDWPQGLVDAVVQTFPRGLNEPRAKSFLASRNWPSGLQDTFIRSCKKIPIRFFIVDDSGSMSINDGRKIVRSGTRKAKMVTCTRWSELTDALSFHIDLAEAALAPTEFRLLNGADPVLVGMGDDNEEGKAFAKEVIAEDPAGQTPLVAHINCVVSAIKKMATNLRANGQRAAVIIATDGESTDGNVAEAMKPLQKLPVWVVIRLATDAPEIVKYWDDIDKQLELEMDVLDDLVQDARQVERVNPWLRYGDELHRMREFGASFKEMDLIDGKFFV